MSASLAVAPDSPEDEQLEFFDPRVYKQDLFSLAGANKHATDRELRPAQQVSGRFTGTVVGLSLEDFGNEKKTPTRVFKIIADYVELD